MASEACHEAYKVCSPASIPVQIESLACYGIQTLIKKTPYEIVFIRFAETS